MSAEILRRAAALMRERAEAVPTDGLSDWWFAGEAPDLMHLHRRERVQIASFGHPAVALAVADLLDELLRSLSVFGEPEDDDPLWQRQTPSRALAVARAYLGSDA